MKKMNKLQEYGQLSQTEQMELKDLAIKLIAIETIFKRLTAEQEEYWKKKEAFFVRLREKHSISAEVPITITDDWIIIEEVK